MFNLYYNYKQLLGREDFLQAAQRIGGDKFKITVTDGKNSYTILTNYKPKKGEITAIMNFGILAHGINRAARVFIDEIYTIKHSRNPDLFDKKADEIYGKYVKWVEKYEQKQKSERTSNF
ncbi:MAG: hypothetical protein N3G19_02430 [Candidatus Pacearchaeota archaeon]|nr:hypothetical protein [Candidatus Pacearchaeota archaeon]